MKKVSPFLFFVFLSLGMRAQDTTIVGTVADYDIKVLNTCWGKQIEIGLTKPDGKLLLALKEKIEVSGETISPSKEILEVRSLLSGELEKILIPFTPERYHEIFELIKLE